MKSHIHRPLYLALWLIIGLAVLQALSIFLYLGWTLWWYDMLMHFLAGMIGGLASFWVLFRSGAIFRSDRSAAFVLGAVLFCVLVAALEWEIFEYLNGLTDSVEGYRLDTMTDVLCGVGGALVSTLWLLKERKRHG